ncbi:hypothetical protein CBR_g50292 [Chara braunii]|uniref:RNA helicase n=1 Tax=Chara braunii TaxID=69332 RepID=A0A388K5B7_CHABU|nr:hypothetical protein CBR_g50292 [Chara braunii]|eukprot:GBG65250.1 hypothetical protein CBR_g50292 [Chara braunii]
MSGSDPVDDRADNRRLTRARALRVPHVFQALEPGEERRIRRARALAAGIAEANGAAREQATAARAAAMANGASSAASSSASSSGTNGSSLGMPTSSTSSSGTSGSTGSRQSSSQMAGSQMNCEYQCATSAVPRKQHCHVSNMTGLPGQLANETIAAYKQRCLAQIEAEEQRLLAVEAARIQAEEAAAAEKLRLQADAEADAQARRKEAQDLLQRHEANSIDRLRFWHFEPNGDEATPEEKHKEFLSKLVTRLLYACNYQRSELERQYQDLTQQHQELAKLRRIVQSHEDATRALNSRLLDLEQAVPGPAVGASSSAFSSRQLEDRVDHVVAMLGDISTFAAPTTTISSQLHTLKTEVQKLQSTNAEDNPKMYKMPTFNLERFDDYTQQDPVLWWEAFTTQLRILPVAKHAYIDALFLNSKGGCQTWLSHLATSHGVDVPDLKDVITWEELTRLWKKRFIVDDAPALAINLRAEVDVDRNEAQTLPPMSVEAVALLRKKFRIRGRECFACAPTGSGKTVAFLLPILMRLKVPTGELRAIVLSPTRELALQIHREVKKLTRGRKFRVRIMTKTTARCMDFKSTPCDILISTPLRLANLITEDKIDLSSVVHLVLDESDKLFDMGFMEQVDRILEACTNTNLQRSLFSATLPETVEELARSVMHDPVRIVIGERNSAASTVSQRMVFVGSEEGKLLAIRQLFTEGQKFPVLVFVQSKERCKELHKELAHDGIRVDSIHADRTQAQREAVLDNFRRGEVWVLIATDVMARGMDFKGVNTVINYDFPQNTAAYIHRIGRSGRAGRAGEAVTFYTEDDAAMLRPIANIIHASGSEVQPWMLALPKEVKDDPIACPAKCTRTLIHMTQLCKR